MTLTREHGIFRFARRASATERASVRPCRRTRLPGVRTVLVAAGMLWGLAGVSASAQEDAAAAAAVSEEPAHYSVEVIIFIYTSSSANELFTPPAPLPGDPPGDYGTVLEEGPVFDDRTPPERTADAAVQSEALGEVPARARIELERLDREAFRMQDTWRRLRQLDAYQPVLHAAWTQTTHEKAVSPALPLRALSDPPLGLDGSIRLYQSRFLHLDVDLTLDATGHGAQDARRTATDRLVNPGSTAATNPDDEAAGLLPPVRYRITEDRIMRDGDIRYFDHPRFGMLARVTRIDEASL